MAIRRHGSPQAQAAAADDEPINLTVPQLRELRLIAMPEIRNAFVTALRDNMPNVNARRSAHAQAVGRHDVELRELPAGKRASFQHFEYRTLHCSVRTWTLASRNISGQQLICTMTEPLSRTQRKEHRHLSTCSIAAQYIRDCSTPNASYAS
jgi:hypothetical protein